jgi:DNA-binding MarR family transcriptional regulator
MEFNQELNKSSKFYSTSLTLMVPIMELVQEGTIAADIARRLNISKSHVSYYIKKSKERGFIKELTQDTFTVLRLTQPGKNFLDQYNKNHQILPTCRAENIQFKAVITRMPTRPVDWKKIQMHNWVQYTSEVDKVKIRINVGKIPTLKLIPSPVEGDDPYELFVILISECYNVLGLLYDRIGLSTGRLHLSSRGEWLVYDPVAKAFCKHNGQVTYEGIGKVNASKPRRIGELEFHDPRILVDYLTMPIRVKNIESKLDVIFDKLNK